MHRSGTSAVAAALEALGLDVGAPDLQMPADAANPAGYYELQEIGDLNDEILSLAGGRWDCPPHLPEGWELEPEMTPYFRRAASVVGTRLAKNRWLIKDPRITLVLPLWRRAVLDRCAAVLIVRDPMEVAWSLALRNGMPILTGLALWSDYNRRALGGLSGLPVHVCAYDELVSDPVSTMTSIGASLASWNELPEHADVDAAAARVRPELRRNTWPRDNADALDVPGEIERFEKFLADLAGAHGVFEPGRPPSSPWEDALIAERRAGVVRFRAAEAQTEVAEAQTEVAEAQTEVAIQERDEALRAWESLGHQLHARNVEFDATCEAARSDKERLGAELEAVRAHLGGDLEAVRARLAVVEEELSEAQTRRRDAEKALRSTTRRLQAIEGRFPIRIARAIKRLRRS
jgi:hypothetical protein